MRGFDRPGGGGAVSWLAVWFVLGLATPLVADEATPPGLEREYGFLEAEDVEKIPLSVVSRGPAIPVGRAPGVVDVITAEDIRASGARTLAELLSQRVGIDVSVNQVVPRGLNTAPSVGTPVVNNRTLLLIDGRPSNDVFFGQFLAGRELPLEHIERVEILRGPGSALYGTNAMAGVINVVTKDAADLPTIGAIGEYGSFDTRRTDLFGGSGGPARNGNFFFRYYGTGGADQIDRNDHQREYFGFARSSLGPVTLEGEALNFRDELPGSEAQPTPGDRANRERYSIGARLERSFGERFRLVGRSYANLYDTRFITAAADPKRTNYEERRIGEELALTARPYDWLSVTFGGEAREEHGAVGPSRCIEPAGPGQVRRSTSGCDLSQNVFAVFLDDRIDLRDDLQLTAGVRYDRVSAFSGRPNPRASLVWSATRATSLKVDYGEAFRVPSFFELRGAQASGSDLLGNPNVFVIGNPNLRPEVVRTVDAEIDHQFSRLLNLRLSAFFTRADDLITQGERSQLVVLGALPTLVPPSGPPPNCSGLTGFPALTVGVNQVCFVNTTRAELFGVELAAGGVAVPPKLPGQLSWGVNYTYQHTTDRFRDGATGALHDESLPLTPANKLNLLFDYRPVPALSLFWHTRWVDREFTDAANTTTLPSRFDTDLNVLYRLTKELELDVGLYNLLGDDQKELSGVPREPRTVLGSVAYRFSAAPAVSAPAAAAQPPELLEARAAVERARAAGAERLGITSYTEAVAHLLAAEELQKRGAARARIDAAAERSMAAARVAEEAARTIGAVAGSEPSPTPAAPPPAPEPSRRRRAPRPRGAEGQPPVAPPHAVGSTPTASRPTPTAPPPVPAPTPTVDVAGKTVLLLRSNASVAIYDEVGAAVTGSLAARIDVQDCRGVDAECDDILRTHDADLVVPIGALAAKEARKLVTGRPVLFCAVANPERYDLRAANVGGVRWEVGAASQLQKIKTFFPDRTRVGVIYNPEATAAFLAEAERAAPKVGIQLVTQVATQARDVGFLFRRMRPDIDVFWLIQDPVVVNLEFNELLKRETFESGLIWVGFAEAFLSQGSAMVIYSTPEDVGRQCAGLAARVLRGEVAVSDVGIRSPDKVWVKK